MGTFSSAVWMDLLKYVWLRGTRSFRQSHELLQRRPYEGNLYVQTSYDLMKVCICLCMYIGHETLQRKITGSGHGCQPVFGK